MKDLKEKAFILDVLRFIVEVIGTASAIYVVLK